MWSQTGEDPWDPYESRVGSLVFRVYPYAMNRWKWGAYNASGTQLAGPVFDPPNSAANHYWWRTYEFAMKKAEEFYTYLKNRGPSTPNRDNTQ